MLFIIGKELLFNISWFGGMHSKKTTELPLIQKIGYSSGNLGVGIIYQIVLSYILFYATVILKLSGTLVGGVLMVGILWDAVTDPIMGYISDNTRFKKFGRRHLYIIIGGVCTAIFNFLIWSINPELPHTIKILWLIIALLFTKTSLTVFGTPYSALGAELSSDYDERSSIQGFRTVFFLIGLFLAVGVFTEIFLKATAEFDFGQENPKAYIMIGASASIIMLLGTFTTYFSTKKKIPFLPGYINKHKNKLNFMDAYKEFKASLLNKDFKNVVLGYTFTNIATALLTGLGMHVYTYTFGFTGSEIAKIFALQFLLAFISQPFWVSLSKKIEKKPAVIYGLVICIIASIMFVLFIVFKDIIYGNIFVFLPFAAVVGLGSGVLFSIPLSMVADTIDIEENITGRRSEGVFYGMITFGYKISQAIVPFLIGILLDQIGFDSDLEKQAETTLYSMGIFMAIGILVALIIGLYFYNKYKLKKEDIQRYRR